MNSSALKRTHFDAISARTIYFFLIAKSFNIFKFYDKCVYTMQLSFKYTIQYFIMWSSTVFYHTASCNFGKRSFLHDSFRRYRFHKHLQFHSPYFRWCYTVTSGENSLPWRVEGRYIILRHKCRTKIVLKDDAAGLIYFPFLTSYVLYTRVTYVKCLGI